MHCAFHLATAGVTIAVYQTAAGRGYAPPLSTAEIVIAYHLIAAQDYTDLPIQAVGKLRCGYTQYGRGRAIFMHWLNKSPPTFWLGVYHLAHNIWGYLAAVGLTLTFFPQLVWWAVLGYASHLLIDYPTHHGAFRIKPFWPIHSRRLTRLGRGLMVLEVEIWFWLIGWFFTRGHAKPRALWRRFVIGHWEKKDWAAYVEYPSWVIFILTAWFNLTT